MYSPKKSYRLTELLKRSDAGDPDAMSALVSLLAAEGYLSDPADLDILERYIACLETLAENGDSDACIMLGDAFKDGTGVRQDPQEAIQWYEKAVERGEPFGNECIGMMYYAGDGIPKDYKKAFSYFTGNEGRKSFCTLYALGEMYRCGLYVGQDERKACACYLKIVNSDEPYTALDDYYWRACYRLGRAFRDGRGTEKNLDSAAQLLSTAKELFDGRENDADCTDITKEALYREWVQVNRETGTFQ